MKSQQELLLALSDCVVNMEDELVGGVAEEYVAAGYPALEGILKGLVDGMEKAADLYEQQEYFIPELLVCADVMYNGLDVLRPHLEQADSGKKHKVVIGVVEGDTHDIGKNLVRIMLEAAGYETYDLGRDVPLQRFVDKAKEVKADVIAMSTLMSTTMPGMGEVIELLKGAGIRERIKVIIGGAPISLAFAQKIGADGYSANAVDAVKVVDRLMGAGTVVLGA
ncbi:corrinoid protein [Candidatus Formimonas warabiya]|uniref:Cobalamin-binding protein n=1 Tax=Formimonas warabiya TaxID=1761012 RepID=A0A3G1KPE1_FORW1|nr:corrinoid protein [Candidatus Formimonas warabiya]ATW24334.1 cobalamin-binding protein [Candidatus Formimonas warabiya]